MSAYRDMLQRLREDREAQAKKGVTPDERAVPIPGAGAVGGADAWAPFDWSGREKVTGLERDRTLLEAENVLLRGAADLSGREAQLVVRESQAHPLPVRVGPDVMATFGDVQLQTDGFIRMKPGTAFVGGVAAVGRGWLLCAWFGGAGKKRRRYRDEDE